MAQDMQDAGNVSAELDAMVCDLIGAFLDDLAAGENPGVVVAIEDAASNRYLAALDEDGEEACLEAATNFISEHKMGLKDDHIFILDNGDTLEMRGGIVKRGTPVESGVVYVDGLRIGDTDPIVLRDRQKLANDGMVTAVAIVSLKHKKIEAIEFSGRGVSFAIDDQFSEDASASIMKTIEKGKFSFTSSGSDAIRKAVRDSLSNFIWSRTRTRPMIIPVVMEV